MKNCVKKTDGTMIASQVELADRFLSRFLGLMGKPALGPEEGLLLTHCSSIHCCFMRFPIDAVYLNRTMKIVGIETVKPWRAGSFFRGAKHVLELPAGKARGLSPGDTLLISEMREKHE